MPDNDYFSADLFNPRPPAKGVLPYPTQARDAPSQDDYAGELRGYYGSAEFNPYSSQYGMVRNGGTKNHGGVDIYAPYYAYPLETPVYAICKGRIAFVYDNESPDDIGNRAWLYPDHAQNDRVILGHLNRFHGRDREVEKGELIGFAGCSGNADAKFECTRIGTLNINSGHVHMAYRPAAGQPVDPLGKVGWSLRFSEIEDPVPLATWESQGHKLAKPVRRTLPTGRLRTKTLGVQALAKSAKPTRLGAPFDTIDFDDPNALAKTAKFYELAHDRLAQPEPTPPAPPTDPKARFAQFGIDEFRKSIVGVTNEVDKLNAIIAALHDIAKAAHESATLKDRIQRSQTLAAEYLLRSMRLLLLAMAGEAMPQVAKKPAIGGEWAGHVPRCGIGLRGKSLLVSAGNGQAALQSSFLKKLVDDPKDSNKKIAVPHSKWTISVSFGAGTPWHAILDERFDEESASEETLMAYSLAIASCVNTLVHISRIVCDYSGVRDEAGLGRLLNGTRAMMGTFSGKSEDAGEALKLLEVLWEIGKDEVLVKRLLKTLAGTAAEAVRQAEVCLKPASEGLDRVRSAYDAIWIEKPT